MDTVLCNRVIDDPRNVKNFICLLAKQYIYRQVCLDKKISNVEFCRYVYSQQSIEKCNAIKNQKVRFYVKKWHDTELELVCENEDYITSYVNSI